MTSPTELRGVAAKAEWSEGAWLCRRYEAGELAKAHMPPFGRTVLREMADSAQTVVCVWKAGEARGAAPRPWVIVAPSAVLRGLTPIGSDPGLGLYAWREFERDEKIGDYTGTSLGLLNAGDEEGASAAINSLPEGQRDKVIEFVRQGGRKIELVDGATAGAPYLPKANDARGLRKANGAQRGNTAYLMPGGEMRSLRKRRGGQGTAPNWGTLTAGGGWEELAGREILWAYGKYYWGAENMKGAGGGTKAERKAAPASAGRERSEAERAQEGAERKRIEARTKRAQQRAAREEEAEAEEVASEKLSGLLLGEVGVTKALTSDAEEIRALFVMEIIVARSARRRGAATAMLAHAVRVSGAREVHWVNRENAAQQEGVRALGRELGFTAVAGDEEEELAYQPRKGEEHVRERYMYAAASQIPPQREVAGAQITAHTAGKGQQIIPKEVRQEARRMMQQLHQAKGGSHEGRTFDVRESIPRGAGGLCVVMTPATSQMEPATDGEEERRTADAAPSGGAAERQQPEEEQRTADVAPSGGAAERQQPNGSEEQHTLEEEAALEEAMDAEIQELAGYDDWAEEWEQYEEGAEEGGGSGAAESEMEPAAPAAAASASVGEGDGRDATEAGLRQRVAQAQAAERAAKAQWQLSREVERATRRREDSEAVLGAYLRGDAEDAMTEEDRVEEATVARIQQALSVPHKLGTGAHRDKQRKGMSVTNVNGLRMQQRKVDGKGTGRWGNGRDLYAGPTPKLRKVMADLEDDGAVMAVWTETHVAGDELEALRGYLRGKGWDSTATGGYITEGGQVRGGVVIAWHTDVMKRVKKVEADEAGGCELLRGRLVTIELVALGCGTRLKMVGAYAPGRGAGEAAAEVQRLDGEEREAYLRREAAHVERFWAATEAEIMGDRTAVLAGDLNAELEAALQRAGKRATAQDKRMQEMLGRASMQAIPAGEATWNGKSEIDHVIVHQEQRQLWGQTEVKPGVTAHDHMTIWTEFKGAADEDEEGKGPKRKQGENWSDLTDAQWERFRDGALEEVQQPGARLARGRAHMEIRRIQNVLLDVASQVKTTFSAYGQTEEAEVSSEEGEGTPTPRTRKEHTQEVARWQRLKEQAEAWSGRGALRSLGTDGEWLARQQCGKAFSAQTAAAGRAARREQLEILCEEARDAALEAATRVQEDEEVDAIEAAMREAMRRDPRTGGTYVQLFEILNGARGRAAGGGAKLTALYLGDDKARGEEAHGARHVRAEARDIGETINQARPAAKHVVRAIMQWAGGRARRTAHAQTRDWVTETCTWERFKEGLARTEPRKGVGCDGFNAYLLRKAPEEVQRRYYKELCDAIREKDFPKEWKEKVAMLFMKPGEDPCELGRRRDIWLECHGLKLTMFMLGNEYEKVADETIPRSQAGNVNGRGCPEQTLVMRCQKEQCAAERQMCCRAYLDLGVFFMSCVREVQWEAERWCGVRPEVTETVKALYEGATGRYETAYGLTETFPMAGGNTQGCNQSPTRSKMQLRLLQPKIRHCYPTLPAPHVRVPNPVIW